MADDFDPRLLAPRWVRTFPADLAATDVLVAAAAVAAFAPVVRDTPVRITVAVPFVLFAPGYALVSALFPEAPGEEPGGSPGLGTAARVVVSVAASAVVVPALGFVLTATPNGFSLVGFFLVVGAFTVAGTVVAAVRRRRLPPESRYTVAYRPPVARLQAELGGAGPHWTLQIALAVTVLLAVSSAAYAVFVPSQSNGFTEFYVSNGTGEHSVGEYPTELVYDRSTRLTAAVANRERQPMAYSLVVQLQRVRIEGNRTVVLERRELARTTRRVSPGRTWQFRPTVTPTLRAEDRQLRLVYLLYRQSPPDRPTAGNAYRVLTHPVNVSDPARG